MTSAFETMPFQYTLERKVIITIIIIGEKESRGKHDKTDRTYMAR